LYVLIVINVGLMHAIVVMDLNLLWFSKRFNLINSISSVPILNTDNHKEWSRKVYLAFVFAELDWVIKKPQPVQPPKPVREEKDDDVEWERKERDYAPLELS
jgi:hypothetical protein